MTQYLAVFAFFIVGFTFMAAMLYFAKYKHDGKIACCGDALEDFEKDDDCDTCPNKDKDTCAVNEIASVRHTSDLPFEPSSKQTV